MSNLSKNLGGQFDRFLQKKPPEFRNSLNKSK